MYELMHTFKLWASLVAQTVKNLPAMRGTRVWSVGWEDPLEKGMTTHSSIHAWSIPQTEEPLSLGSLRVRRKWAANTFMTVKECYGKE